MLMLEDQDYCNMDMCMDLDALGCPIPKHDTINLYTKERNTVYGKFSLYEAQKWLRKKKGMLLQPTYLELSNRWICVIRDNKRTRGYSTENQETYEDSLTAGINECIKLLKNYELESNDIVSDTN